MGGAQPLAATMNGGVLLAVEVDRAAHRAAARDALPRRDRAERSTTRSRARAKRSRPRRPLSIGLVGNAADVLPELVTRGVVPDLVTDQTCAHDPLNGYVPTGLTLRSGARAPRAATRQRYMAEARRSMAEHVQAMLELKAAAPSSSTTATTSAPRRRRPASPNAFDFPGFVPAYIRPLFCEGKGPFRWACLSGDPEDIARDRRRRARDLPGRRGARPLDRAGARARRVPGPAGAHLLARLRRAREARACVFNELVRTGRVKAPDRDRPRPPRRRLGRLAQPRDRGACGTARTPSPTGRS